MKAIKAKWLNVIALVLLYAIAAVVACLLVHMCNIYMLAIAENIRFYAYIGVSVVAFMVLIFRLIKFPLTKLMRFEWVIAILLTALTLFAFVAGLIYIMRAENSNRRMVLDYIYLGYLPFALLIPIALMALSPFSGARYLLEITERAFLIYMAAAFVAATLYTLHYPCTVFTFLSIILPLILFAVWCAISLQKVKNKATLADMEKFQSKMWNFSFIFMIILLSVTFGVTSAFDFLGILLSVTLYGFITLTFIPCVLYFVVVKIACFKYKREEGENL